MFTTEIERNKKKVIDKQQHDKVRFHLCDCTESKDSNLRTSDNKEGGDNTE